jgi:AcrR family transcriptional regulator
MHPNGEGPDLPQRLSREEAHARTRRLVMQSAAQVFARKGFAGATIEEIAAAAGFSRGAVYSNFTDKTDLFFAVLEERERQRVEQVHAILEGADSASDFVARLAVSDRYRGDDVETWRILAIEFWLYAMRDDRVRERLAMRDRLIRRWLAAGIATLLAADDTTPPLPVDDLACVVHALDEGLALQRLIDPESVRPDLFLTAVDVLQRALGALAVAGAAPPASPSPEPEA